MSDRLHQQLSWQIGDVSITRLVEVVLNAPIKSLFPDNSVEELAAHYSWLKPDFINADGNMNLSIHAFLIQAGGLKMIVDTCAGNNKDLPLFPEWNRMNNPFLENMTRLGFAPDTIDRVMCTHMHFDHVGWNTVEVNGKWVPTFPNARYLYAKGEWAFWKDHEDPYGANTIEHALKPVLDAGLVDLVEDSHRVNDEISLIPTPGHTPGHVSVLIQSRGQEAVITGDMFHHPLQMAHPEWIDMADTSSALAEKTRREFMARFGNKPSLVLGTHFATPTGGHIGGDATGSRFKA